MASLTDLKNEATKIRNEVGAGQNTARKIGNILLDILSYVNELFSDLKTKIENFVTKKEMDSAVEVEKKRASTVEDGLSKSISNEASRAKNAESNLSNEINALADGVADGFLNTTTIDDLNKETQERVRFQKKLSVDISEEKTRAEDAEKSLSDTIDGLVIELEAEFLNIATKEALQEEIKTRESLNEKLGIEVSNENVRAVKAERDLSLKIGERALQSETYTKRDVDKIISSILAGGTCGCGGENCVVIDLNAPSDELFDILSSNLNKRFMGYLKMGENLFDLFVSWVVVGQKVEISRSEEMKIEIIILEKQGDGSLIRSEEFIKYI